MKREQLLPSSTTFHSEFTRALYLSFLVNDLIQLETQKLNRDKDEERRIEAVDQVCLSSFEFYPCVLSLRSFYIFSICIVLFQDFTSLPLFNIELSLFDS